MANGQTDVQQLIQGLVPGSVNNGNPNTAYNVAPPTTDAAGNWFSSNLPTAASLGPRQQVALTPWEAPTPLTGSSSAITTILPTWDGNAGWSPSVNPIIRPPVTAPIGDPGVQGPTPANPVNRNPNIANPSATRGPTGAGSRIGTFPGGDQFGDLDQIRLGIQNGAFLPTDGMWGEKSSRPASVQRQEVMDLFKEIPALGKAIGLTPDGDWDWQQVLDSVGDFLGIKGDMWLPASNNMDWGQVLTGIAGMVLGPVGTLVGNWFDRRHESKAEREEKQALQDMLNNRYPQVTQPTYTDPFMNQDAINRMVEFGRDQMRGGTVTVRPDEVISIGGNCVVVDSVVYGKDHPAGDIKENETITVVDGGTLSMMEATVTYSEPVVQPCVRIVTANGTALTCSVTAPIADEDGEEVLARNLTGLNVLTFDGHIYEVSKVIEVVDVGEQTVQHISCEDNYFLAGEQEGKYLLHHNKVKIGGPARTNTPMPSTTDRAEDETDD